jgi:urease accessory protein
MITAMVTMNTTTPTTITAMAMPTAEPAPALGGLPLLRLCQLVSPAAPVGAFNFSQGLEYAESAGWVRDADGAHDWIAGIARHAIGTLDLPLLWRMHAAWSRDDEAAVRALSQRLIAGRDSAELRAEDRHMGRALAKLLLEIGIPAAAPWRDRDEASYAALFALAAVHGGVDARSTALGYLWAWSENQVIAAVKLLPLGQSAGQRVLDRLLREMPAIVADAERLPDEDIGVASPAQGLASALHETQYTRLFRS